eukprot:TRINITY_DN58512_c0_g1_i1.p3 TRINITY_DN58512_c0_g1~~TRINITY_DN58512_c0_g1_i1.p3  ORF type:complete len:149 (-),score=42.53 TRINITY_DN58512_c0_g1_i1:127-573(-)
MLREQAKALLLLHFVSTSVASHDVPESEESSIEQKPSAESLTDDISWEHAWNTAQKEWEQERESTSSDTGMSADEYEMVQGDGHQGGAQDWEEGVEDGENEVEGAEDADVSTRDDSSSEREERIDETDSALWEDAEYDDTSSADPTRH